VSDADALIGFSVVTREGKLLGEVAGVSGDAIVVAGRRLRRRTLRLLPTEYALVWRRMRSVIAQVSERELLAAPPAADPQADAAG
jgi:hypothetical protein